MNPAKPQSPSNQYQLPQEHFEQIYGMHGLPEDHYMASFHSYHVPVPQYHMTPSCYRPPGPVWYAPTPTWYTQHPQWVMPQRIYEPIPIRHQEPGLMAPPVPFEELQGQMGRMETGPREETLPKSTSSPKDSEFNPITPPTEEEMPRSYQKKKKGAQERNRENQPPLGRPRKLDSLQNHQDLIDRMLAKRSSSSNAQDLNLNEDKKENGDSEENQRNQESTQEEMDLKEESATLGEEEQTKVIARLDNGIEILKSMISANEMAFIRNYSRMIGYSLKTTQRNTKLGYFSSVCPVSGCHTSIIVRKFSLVTSKRMEHNHPSFIKS